MRIYINNFVDDLNFNNIVLYIGNVDLNVLEYKLKEDKINFIYNFKYCRKNKLMFVENCALENVDNEDSLFSLLKDGYSIYNLRFDEKVRRYYIEIDIELGF